VVLKKLNCSGLGLWSTSRIRTILKLCEKPEEKDNDDLADDVRESAAIHLELGHA
jgi:hypothetical protein